MRSGSQIKPGADHSLERFTETQVSVLFTQSLLLPFRQVCLRWSQEAETHSAHGEKQIWPVGSSILGRCSDPSCWSSMSLMTLFFLKDSE